MKSVQKIKSRLTKISNVEFAKGLFEAHKTNTPLDGLFSIDGGVPKATNWKLVRERDGLTKESKEILWLEWNEEGHMFKHTQPKIGRSLLMSPFNLLFTWQTTDITEIIEQKTDYVKFKTGNSTYELYFKQ